MASTPLSVRAMVGKYSDVEPLNRGGSRIIGSCPDVPCILHHSEIHRPFKARRKRSETPKLIQLTEAVEEKKEEVSTDVEVLVSSKSPQRPSSARKAPARSSSATPQPTRQPSPSPPAQTTPKKASAAPKEGSPQATHTPPKIGSSKGKVEREKEMRSEEVQTSSPFANVERGGLQTFDNVVFEVDGGDESDSDSAVIVFAADESEEEADEDVTQARVLNDMLGEMQGLLRTEAGKEDESDGDEDAEEDSADRHKRSKSIVVTDGNRHLQVHQLRVDASAAWCVGRGLAVLSDRVVEDLLRADCVSGAVHSAVPGDEGDPGERGRQHDECGDGAEGDGSG
ncbi:hypothetical protein BLNAU_10263 [Blattamonas nauphoetae]|uniref:Uncharacterized protein n=1 Tax=Blattamonas nauphoetae TaxID=2049346 RepID=A0ABQ9XTH8_9EUKA|nr:hypothetical protein BLNAU_10263 [Blattamonas nauphoetae]